MVEDALEASHRGRGRNLVIVFAVGQRERERLGEAGGHVRVGEDHPHLAEEEESGGGGVLIVEGGVEGAERKGFAETRGVSGSGGGRAARRAAKTAWGIRPLPATNWRTRKASIGGVARCQCRSGMQCGLG